MDFQASPVARSVPFDNSGTSFYSENCQDGFLETRQLVTYDPEFITTSLNGTSNLLFTNKTLQIVTGTATGHSVVLPNATTLFNGRKYEIANQSSQPINIKTFGGTSLFFLNPASVAIMTLQDNTTSAGTWISLVVSTIATGIQSYNIISSTAFTTSVRYTAFDLITGFSLTPLSGTYGCWFSCSSYYTTTPKKHYWAFYRAGVQIADSLRSQDTAHSNQTMMDTTQSIISLNGSQTLDVRVSCDNTGSLTVNQRSMLLIRLGT